jgi:hypothetical protein
MKQTNETKQKLARLEKQVAILSLARELKYVDYAFAANVNSSWSVTTPSEGILSGVAQGDSSQQRDGLGYDIVSLDLTGYVNYSSTSGVAVANLRSDELFRFILVRNHQTAGAAIDPTKVLDLTIGAAINAPLNLTNNNFTILSDETIVVTRPALVDHNATYPSDTYVQAEAKAPISLHHRFKRPIKIRSTGATAGYASYQNDSITLITVSTLSCNLYYTSRLRFFDS